MDDAYIVGGAVRDILLNNELHDIDIVLKGDCYSIAKEFALVVDAVCIILDEEFSIMRIIKDNNWIDISRLRCDSIFIDLTERDFTINAMAIPINALNNPYRSVIDFYGGWEDLLEGYVRMVAEENLIKDPLRLIRAFRFATSLDFAIEGRTLRSIKEFAPLINSVAYERIYDELKKILVCQNSSTAIRLMAKLKILTHIFAMNFCDSSLIYFMKLEALINNINSFFGEFSHSFHAYLSDAQRLIMLKFIGLFSKSEEAIKAAYQLKMSNKDIDLLKVYADNKTTLIGFYKDNIKVDSEEIINFILKAEKDIYGLVLLDMAQYIDELDGFIKFLKEIIVYFETVFKERQKKLPLLTGNDLIRELNIRSSPLFRQILKKIELLFLLGMIDSKESALKEARGIYNLLTSDK